MRKIKCRYNGKIYDCFVSPFKNNKEYLLIDYKGGWIRRNLLGTSWEKLYDDLEDNHRYWFTESAIEINDISIE